MTTAQIIRELREDHDLYQKQIAAELQVSQQYYSEYENDVRDLPIKHLKKLCLYYHVSADYILGLPEGLPYPKR